jgi:hypothetical protein
MESLGLRVGQLRGMCVCAVASIAVLASAAVPASASSVSPVLEFVPSGAGFPVEFEADGGEVTAALDEFEPVVHCTGSHGEGVITGPRSTLSHYVFTGCKAQGGSENGNPCQSEGASSEEIVSEEIEADLVYIDQANKEVGMLLNPVGGIYINFECGGEEVKGLGPFLSPVGPINQQATSFTADLFRSGAQQIPNEYENALGEKRSAIPMGERGSHPLATTGVELSFTINTNASLKIEAITAAEIEARQREDEAAAAEAAQKRQEEEAAAAAAAKKRQGEEAAAAAAAQERQEEEAAVAAAVRNLRKEGARLRRIRHKLRLIALKQCRMSHSKHKRVRCEERVKKKYSRRRRTSCISAASTPQTVLASDGSPGYETEGRRFESCRACSFAADLWSGIWHHEWAALSGPKRRVQPPSSSWRSE